MKKDFKINDWIVFTDKEFSKWWKEKKGISLYGKIGKIIDIDNPHLSYLIEFKEFINGHDGDGKGKDGHCCWCDEKRLSLYKDFYKLKKFIEG